MKSNRPNWVSGRPKCRRPRPLTPSGPAMYMVRIRQEQGQSERLGGTCVDTRKDLSKVGSLRSGYYCSLCGAEGVDVHLPSRCRVQVEVAQDGAQWPCVPSTAGNDTIK
ncbi:hypothetical protein AcV5_002259 [Taiwanofungus camphoratus]|nr:hypothetical protein AcV5_002259 [Antrodia cinnamomea]